MDKFWENVRARRQLLKISQADMATALGVRQPTYAYYEANNSKKVTKAMIETIARVLDATTEELLENNKNPLADYPDEIVRWLQKKDAREYVLKAYMEYLKERL